MGAALIVGSLSVWPTTPITDGSSRNAVATSATDFASVGGRRSPSGRLPDGRDAFSSSSASCTPLNTLTYRSGDCSPTATPTYAVSPAPNERPLACALRQPEAPSARTAAVLAATI